MPPVANTPSPVEREEVPRDRYGSGDVDEGARMQGSTPQHYTIADFLKWSDDAELVLNPKFQRGSVWPAPARTYLIDSILRGYPIPKLLLRTTVDRDSRRTIRDVVDGQQRLRTIIDFAGNRFALGPKATEFQGSRYADLDNEIKDNFLAYKLTCEQLINASDEDVLEVFVRINSYAVPVNEAELRNARFENDFSELVKFLSQRLQYVWELGIISNRDRVRMLDQSFVAEILGFYMFGVTDGGEARITRVYQDVRNRTVDELPDPLPVERILREAVGLVLDLRNEPIVQRPHFLMLAAAVMYARDQLIPGRLDVSQAPPVDRLLQNTEAATESLRTLNAALAGEETARDLTEFVAARTSTQRMKSRQTRFNYICRALAGEFA
jgi:Protein of unknown function DUF262